MEAEVVASSLSSVDSHQLTEPQNGMVDEILRPEKASMNLLVQTDTTNMGRVRTCSTCNMDDVLQLDVEGSTLNTMMLNEEVMEQSMNSWSADIHSVVAFSTIDVSESTRDEAHVDILPPYTMANSSMKSHTVAKLIQEDARSLKVSSPSLNMLNSSLTPGNNLNSRPKNNEEPDFNVLHLDDHAITDLEAFPLFSIDDDVGTLLEQFEEVSQSGSVDADVGTTSTQRKQSIYDLPTDSITVPVHRVSSDSSLCHLVSASDHSNARVGNIKEESPEVVRLLKAKPALAKLSKAPTGDNRNMPNAEVLKKIKSNNKRKSAILLSDALPSRPDKSCKSSKHQSLPVYASKKLRKLLGHTMEDSDHVDREKAKTLDQDSIKSSHDLMGSSLQDGTCIAKGLDICISPATPETITAPSTPAPPSGGNSRCSTPDVPKRKISLSAYKSRVGSVQKGSSSGSNTPVDSGRSTPVKEFEDNTQIIINTVKAKLTAQLDGGKLTATTDCNSDYYSIVMDHDYCQVAKLHKKEVKTPKVADTWGVNPHSTEKAKAKKTISRCSSFPVLSMNKTGQSREHSRHTVKSLPNSEVKLPDLLAHPPPHPIRTKEKPSSPVKQTPAVEILKHEMCESVEPPKETVVNKEPETDSDGQQQSSMLKDLLLSPELEKEMKEQAKVDREESMRRMSSRSSLSPDIEAVTLEDEHFMESTEVLDLNLTETNNLSEEDFTETTEKVEEIEQNRFSKFESEKENTLLNDTKVADTRKPNSKHSRRRYRKKDRSKSPENSKEPYFDKLPTYCTALAHKNDIDNHKSFNDIHRLANSGLPTRDRDPSPEKDSAMFNKVPDYFRCFTNSTKYDNIPEPESSVVGEDPYHWTEELHGQHSNNSSRATSPGLVISTGLTSRANSRSRPSSRTSAQIRANSNSPTTVTSVNDLRKRSGSQRNRKRSYSSSSCSRSRSYSRSRSSSRSSSRSHSRSRSRGRSRRSRSPGYRRRNKRRKYSRSRSRSTSWDRWRTEQRKRREEEKRSKMKQRKIVYVGGIPDSFTKRDLRNLFDRFGKIEDVSLHFREHGDNYGFVTFTYRCDAISAIERGNSVPGCQDFDLCFGGRRLFCQTRYEDLDGNMEEEEEMAPVLSQPSESVDFDKLLRQALKKKI